MEITIIMKNKKEPLISIIVPFYNGENYLKQCVDSILNQDYKNLEIIFINDGSKDNTMNLLNEYRNKDSRIKVICQENAGVSAARNTALNNIHGEYVCLIDQDDCISKNYISYFYSLIEENNADISLSPKPNKFKDEIYFENVDLSNDIVEIWDGKKAVTQMLYYNLVIAPWNKMISSDLINKNNIKFDSTFFGGEGFSFSIDCFKVANRVAVGQKKVYNYRVDNPNSGMTKFSMKIIDSSFRAQKHIKENLKNNDSDIIKACKYSNWHTACDCLNTIIGCKVIKEHKDTYRKIKNICQKDALIGFLAPIPKKEKIKCFMYFVSPYIASKIINHFRLRKFTIGDEN